MDSGKAPTSSKFRPHLPRLPPVSRAQVRYDAGLLRRGKKSWKLFSPDPPDGHPSLRMLVCLVGHHLGASGPQEEAKTHVLGHLRWPTRVLDIAADPIG